MVIRLDINMAGNTDMARMAHRQGAAIKVNHT